MAYIPGDHVVVAKALGPSGDSPMDGRTMFYDKTVTPNKYRPFVSTAELISYCTSANQRQATSMYLVNTGGTLSAGVVTGGTNTLWHWKDNKTDGGLVQVLNADNIVDGTTNHAFTAADDTKLAGIATGATANDTDANLKNRANHTGTQSADTIVDGTTNHVFTAADDTKLSGIATGATANQTDAFLLDRTNHTGTQAQSTITNLVTDLAGKASSSHQHNASDINSGTLDGDRLPALSTTKKGGVPATGTPSGKFLKDDGTWDTPAGGGGGVSSFNTRTGAVVPVSGDYTGAQITQDSTHRFVTDAQISAWNAGSTGVYSDVLARVFDVRDYNILPTNSEATNTANMATLLATVYGVGGGTIDFPEASAPYRLTIVLPTISHPVGNWTPLPIRFRGSTPPFMAIGTLAGGFVRTTDDWTIVRSTGSTNTLTGTNGWIVYFDDIEFQQTGTAAFCIDLTSSAECVFHNVLITNGYWPGAGVKSPGIGLGMPGVNNGGLNHIDNVAIAGFEVGIDPGEHLTGNHLTVMGCTYGWKQTIIHHANIMQRYQTAHNIYDIYCDGGTDGMSFSWIQIDQMDIEHNGACRSNIYDPYGGLRGEIKYCNILGGNGAFQQFVSSGHLPQYLHLARTGDLLKDYTAASPTVGGANPLFPLAALADRWGQTLERGAWYSYGYETEVGLDESTSYPLAAGDDGWIAQKYIATSKGGFLGLKTGGGAIIGFFFDDDGTLGTTNGSGSYINNGVALVDGAWYRLNRASGTYTIQSSINDGASWSTVYTFSSPFGGTTPAGSYIPWMDTNTITFISPAAARKVGPVYYPQALFGGVDATPPTLTSATVENATPSQVDIVFSEGMDATWSASSAFTVTGHTVSSITRVNATSGYLTLSTPFVPGETRTLSYTQPGTNNMKDLAGNLLANISSASITDNVLPTTLSTPTLTASVISSTQIDLSWTNVANESSYKLEWSPNGTSGWTQIGGTIATNTTTFSHTGLTASTHYYYRISAIGDGVIYLTSSFGTDDDTTSSAGDTTPPVLSSAIAQDANPDHVNIIFSEAMDATWSAASAFGITGHTVTAITRTGSSTGYLTVTPAFTEGETQNLTYTQPGTNNMKDLAGNLLANIAAKTVVSAIINPTLLTATVEDSTPTHIDLVFDEPMNTTWSAAAAWTVTGGHSVTSVTQLTATTGYLTVSPAFVNGETRTLAYTQPGTNNMQDVAGNLLANITAASITDNVLPADTTAPTLVSATVEDATPTQVDLVFDEAMNSTWSAFSAFTVSGHTVSAITRTGPTTGYLTVDAFVASETRTLAYTQPGTNNMQDLASNLLANFSGFSITDNVGVADTTPPTLINAAVSNSTPNRVDITFSEPMLSVWSPDTAWSISGHSVVGVVRSTSTTGYLVVTPSFINGESRTLGYTAPGLDYMTDMAGNSLANISGFSVTNSVSVDSTAPTLLSASVETATPTRIDIVFSEDMNSTWSASSAFAVSGNTVSSITRETYSSGYLTVASPISAGASPTISYTQPGSNKMQDQTGNLLANFSGTSITNNVTSNTVVTQDFESTSVGAVPTNWATQTGNSVTANSYFSALPTGGTKEFDFTLTASTQPAIYTTGTVPLDSTVICDIIMPYAGFGYMGGGPAQRFSSTNPSSFDAYLCKLDHDSGAGDTVTIAKIQGGYAVVTSLALGSASFWKADEIYRISYRITAAHQHRVMIQRQSDKLYLSSTGQWVSQRGQCITFTEGSPALTSAGYAGISAAVIGPSEFLVDNVIIS